MSCKKVFFMKKIFFSFTKKLFYSCRKTFFFFLISTNLTASAFLLPRRILYNGDMPRQKPTTEANFESCFLSNQVALCICWWQFWHNVARFDLALWKAVMKTFAPDLPFSNLIFGVEWKKVLLQKTFPNRKTIYVSHSYWKLEKFNFFFLVLSIKIQELWLKRHQNIYWTLQKWRPTEMESKHVEPKC